MAVEVGGESELGGIRRGDGLSFVREAEERGDGAERLLGRKTHPCGHVAHHGRFEEQLARRMAFAACQHARALRDGVGDMRLDFFHRRFVDERPLRHTALESVADLDAADSRREFFCERVVHAVLHVKAVRANAGLPRVAVLRSERAFDGGVEIRVVEYDEGRVAA